MSGGSAICLTHERPGGTEQEAGASGHSLFKWDALVFSPNSHPFSIDHQSTSPELHTPPKRAALSTTTSMQAVGCCFRGHVKASREHDGGEEERDEGSAQPSLWEEEQARRCVHACWS